MKAIITGASSGLGYDFAYILSNMGYDLVVVGRNKKKLQILKDELKTDVEIVALDISSTFNCMKLYNKYKKDDIDILINNAGFGVFGYSFETKLEKELDMIDTNIKAVHTLTKLFLSDFVKKDKGYILNVASLAAFMPGPLMASYYASKSYVLNYTNAIYEELRRINSKVYVGSLCPGPVNTNFNNVAGVEFGVKSLDSIVVAEYAIKKMFKRKLVIIPSVRLKIVVFFKRFISNKLLLKITYFIQKEKIR